MMKRRLTVSGMSCMHCVKHIHDALMEIHGVTSVEIDLKTQIVFLESKGIIDNDKIKSTVSDAGYEVLEIDKI